MPTPRLLLVLGATLALLLTGGPARSVSYFHITLRGQAFALEVAADPLSRSVGLGGRTSIPGQGGMLFVFPDDVPRTFWMRDCLVDMSLIFLDRAGRIVAVHEMVLEPPRTSSESELQYLSRLRRYPSHAPARYAIELRSGSIQRFGFRVGQHLDLSRAPSASR
jgi:uncharacterized membrane protein (UPF0127 family)